MDMWEVGCSGGQNGGGALARVFPQHLRAAAGDPPDGHVHLAAPDGVGPRVRLDPAGHLHEVHLGGEVGLSWPTPRKNPSSVPRRALETILEALMRVLIGVQLGVKAPRARNARVAVSLLSENSGIGPSRRTLPHTASRNAPRNALGDPRCYRGGASC
jgi:hypothetical protein